MKYSLFILLLFVLIGSSQAQNQAPVPVLGNITVDTATRTVSIAYDVTDAENDSLEVFLRISADAGATFQLPVDSVSGDIGWPVVPGTGKIAVWHYDRDSLSAITGGGPLTFQVRLIADDRFTIDIQDLVDAVDSSRIRANLEFIEGIRHRVADPTHLTAVRDTLERRFIAAGLEADRQVWTFSGFTAQNLIGWHRGTTNEAAMLFNSGHFDSVNNSPGADDNGSSVAAMMEIMRVLAGYNFEKSIRFLGFDLEEAGLLGSEQYVTNGLAGWEEIEGLINMEMIGYKTEQVNTQSLPFGFDILFPAVSDSVEADSFRGNFILNVANVNSSSLKQAFDNSADQYVPNLRELSLEVPGNGQSAPDLRRSDHASFWDAGYPALMITDGADTRYPYYHTPNDTLENLDFQFMTQVAQTAAGTLAELAGIQHSGIAEGGTFNLDLPTGVATEIALKGLQVFPNPFSGTLHIDFELPTPSSLSFKVTDSKGGTIWERNITEASAGEKRFLWMDSQLAPGLYQLEIRTGEQVTVKKVIRN